MLSYVCTYVPIPRNAVQRRALRDRKKAARDSAAADDGHFAQDDAGDHGHFAQDDVADDGHWYDSQCTNPQDDAADDGHWYDSQRMDAQDDAADDGHWYDSQWTDEPWESHVKNELPWDV